MAPHQRLGGTLNLFVADDPRLPTLEVLFNRGFQYQVEDRFQSCVELMDRLEQLSRQTTIIIENPIDVAGRLSVELEKRNRKTQLIILQDKVIPLLNTMYTYLEQFQNRLGQFKLVRAGYNVRAQMPADMDVVSTPNTAYMLSIQGHDENRTLWLGVGAKGQECHVLYTVGSMNRGTGMADAGQWVSLLPFDPENPPTSEDLGRLLNGILNRMMQELVEHVDQRPTPEQTTLKKGGPRSG